MRSKFISSGIMNNPGQEPLNISDIINQRIIGLDIYAIPLFSGFFAEFMQGMGTILQPFFHPAISPTLYHYSIKLNLENIRDIILIEYGKYLTEEGLKYFREGELISGSSNYKNENNNKAKYYYINEDGFRITRLENSNYNNHLFNNSYNVNNIFEVSYLQNLGFSSFSYLDNNINVNITDSISIVKCEAKNKMTLRELISKFQGDEWKAKAYNVLGHNCQDFAAEVVKILKAVRINKKDKIRMNEKYALPNCLIKVLTENEKITAMNVIGRIPILGLLFDILFALFSYEG